MGPWLFGGRQNSHRVIQNWDGLSTALVFVTLEFAEIFGQKSPQPKTGLLGVFCEYLRFSNFMLAITAGVCLWMGDFQSLTARKHNNQREPATLCSACPFKTYYWQVAETLKGWYRETSPETWYWALGSHFIPFNLTDVPLDIDGWYYLKKHGSEKVTKTNHGMKRHHFDMKPETVQNLWGLPFGSGKMKPAVSCKSDFPQLPKHWSMFTPSCCIWGMIGIPFRAHTTSDFYIQTPLEDSAFKSWPIVVSNLGDVFENTTNRLGKDYLEKDSLS